MAAIMRLAATAARSATMSTTVVGQPLGVPRAGSGRETRGACSATSGRTSKRESCSRACRVGAAGALSSSGVIVISAGRPSPSAGEANCQRRRGQMSLLCWAIVLLSAVPGAKSQSRGRGFNFAAGQGQDDRGSRVGKTPYGLNWEVCKVVCRLGNVYREGKHSGPIHEICGNGVSSLTNAQGNPSRPPAPPIPVHPQETQKPARNRGFL
jgi:hypothetical protein